MATEIFIPKMGANIEKVIIGKINVNKGDHVNKGEILFEIVTDKATFDVEADASGIILQFNSHQGQEFNVLDVIGYIGEKDESIAVKLPNKQTTQLKITPKAKKLAKENNINIESLNFDNNKIIREEDIVTIINSKNKESNYSLQKFSPAKLAEITNLSFSKEYIYSSVTIQVSTKEITKNVNKIAEKNSLRLSFNVYLYYCVALLLRDFPDLNSTYVDEGVNRYKHINLGIAMNSKNGLIVPVINDVDKISLDEFVLSYTQIIMKMLNNKITSEDMKNGSFTITDLSSFNVFNFIPVINKNQSSILAIGSQYDSIKMEKGKLIYDPKMNLTLSFDHRVINGVYALQFLQKLNDKMSTIIL